jgi:hypothetical protein
MTFPYPRQLRATGSAQAAIADRPLRESLLVGFAWLASLALALGIAVAVPHPNLGLALAVMLGAVAVLVLVLTKRLEVKVTLVALYLGLLDGPIKLVTGGHELASSVRDVLIVAVCLAPVLSLVVRRERVRLPPLSGWVLGYVGLVLIEAFNPKTAGLLKALAGFRQLLEWVPFFFFGFVLMRSKERFRKLFLVLGVVALANGAVATYQTFLSPAQVASWGPGYHSRIYPSAGGGRAYASEGEGRVRPLGLGSDSGFGGGVGLLALPGALALLATTRGRRRWVGAVLSLGALIAILTSLGRLQVVGAAIAVIAFALLSSVVGRRVSRPLAAVLGVIVLAVPLGAVFVSTLRSGTFSRYESISPTNVASTSTSYKQSSWQRIPHQLGIAPLGVGLALNVIALALRRLRRIADVELRIDLAAVVAPVIALVLMGFSGPLSTSAALGPYFWFAAGIAAYWFTGARRAATAGTSAARSELR